MRGRKFLQSLKPVVQIVLIYRSALSLTLLATVVDLGGSSRLGNLIHKRGIFTMRSCFSFASKFAALCAGVSLLVFAAAAQDAASPLTLRGEDGHAIHILPEESA